MRFFTIAIFLIGLNSISLAQNKQEQLAQLYTQDELTNLKTNDPKEFRLISYALENGCYVAKAPQGKSEGFTKSINWSQPSEPKFFDLKKTYNVNLENFNQYIRINGSDKMVVVKSRFVLENELSNQKN